jgi:hypothetical protein
MDLFDVPASQPIPQPPEDGAASIEEESFDESDEDEEEDREESISDDVMDVDELPIKREDLKKDGARLYFLEFDPSIAAEQAAELEKGIAHMIFARHKGIVKQFGKIDKVRCYNMKMAREERLARRSAYRKKYNSLPHVQEKKKRDAADPVKKAHKRELNKRPETVLNKKKNEKTKRKAVSRLLDLDKEFLEDMATGKVTPASFKRLYKAYLKKKRAGLLAAQEKLD